MSSVPHEVRERLREDIWKQADQLGWSALSDVDRALFYEHWTEDPTIGGVLSRFLKKGQVRVYVKDSLLKPYLRSRAASFESVRRHLGILGQPVVLKTRIKPHGVLMEDGTMVVWARARDWKSALLGLFEWSSRHNGIARRRVVLFDSNGRFSSISERAIITSAALALSIEMPIFLD